MVHVASVVLALAAFTAVHAADETASPCAAQDARVAQLLDNVASLQASESKYQADVADLTTKLDGHAALATQVSALTSDKEVLASKLAKLQADTSRRIAALEADLAASKAASADAKALAGQLTAAKDEIALLQADLAAASVIDLQVLLSAYYDRAADAYAHSDEYLAAASEKSRALYAVHLAPWADEATKHAAKHGATVQALYAKHAAATVDPLVAQLQAQVQPVLDTHGPVVQQHAERAVEQARVVVKRGQAAFKRGRKSVISGFKSNPRLAPYATKVVDTTLYLMAIPLVLAAARLAWSLVLFILSTTVFLGTCCGCCGLVGRKRKPATREVATPVATAPTKQPAKKTKDAPKETKPKEMPAPASMPSKKKAKKTQ